MKLKFTWLMILFKWLKKDTCGLFQLSFHVNLFNPHKSGKTIHAKKLNKKTVEVLLNEKLSTNQEENEDRVEAFTNENNIMHR